MDTLVYQRNKIHKRKKNGKGCFKNCSKIETSRNLEAGNMYAFEISTFKDESYI